MNFEKVTALLDCTKEKYENRCVDCIVMKDHEVIYHYMAGTMDAEDSIPVSENNLYDIYSASKVLTMIAAMQLVEKGVISLEDEVARYLPEFSDMLVVKDFDLTDFVKGFKFVFGWPSEQTHKVLPAKNKIHIHELMSMTAGLSYQLGAPAILDLLKKNPQAGTREIIRAFAKSPLLFEPGTRYAYSMGHDVMAAVVEVASGMRFSDYMKTYIFDPLGAFDMYYHSVEPERTVCLYDGKDPKTGKPIPQKRNITRINDTYESGGGGVRCSVNAYALVIDALANGGVGKSGAQILKPGSIGLMSTNRLDAQQLDDFHIGGKTEYGYGLGVRTLLDQTKSKSPLGEFGWDGAAGAYVVADPVNHLALFYVQAAPESGTAFSEIHPALRDLVYEALG